MHVNIAQTLLIIYTLVMRKTISGFTIVELLIVIVVIAVLALISIVAYFGLQNRAIDNNLRNGMSQLEKALKLYAQDYGRQIPGSSGATKNAEGRCVGGGNGYVGANIGYACSIEEELVATGYLPSDFIYKLPRNTYFGNSSDGGRRSFMIYACGAAGSGLYTLSSTLRTPTATDESNFQQVISKGCADETTQRGYGMRTARIIQL